MDRRSVKSQAIRSIGYDAATETLELEFNGNPPRVYQYLQFPPREWELFQQATSIGGYFSRHIGGNYQIVRIEPELAEQDLKPLLEESLEKEKAHGKAHSTPPDAG